MSIEATRAGFEASFEEADFYNKQTRNENFGSWLWQRIFDISNS
ncbi:MAG: hypothetical protein ACI4HQ_00305 [Acetatifactor sp.]